MEARQFNSPPPPVAPSSTPTAAPALTQSNAVGSITTSPVTVPASTSMSLVILTESISGSGPSGPHSILSGSDIPETYASGDPTPIPPSDSLLLTSTLTSSISLASGSTQATAKSSGGGGLRYGAKLAVIIVPTLVVLALIPIIYICYIHRRYKKRRESVLPEVRQQPREAALLHAHHPSHDCVSLSTTPFTDSERAKEPSVEATWERHIEDTSRAPSPVLPSPSRPAFHVQEQWPLSGPLPEPPPPPPKNTERIDDDDDPVRPPSSNYGSRQAMLPRPPSEHEDVVSPQEEGYEREAAIANRQSDAVSELSFDSRSRRHRTKSMDGESFISAMDEEPVHDPMPTRHVL